MKKILFIVSEDWFFRSHFRAFPQRARQDGYEVVIAGRRSGAMDGENVRVIDVPFARGGFGLGAIARQLPKLQAIVDAERPDIIHPFSLKSIALTMMLKARGAGRAFALTGRGYLALSSAPAWAKFIGWCFRHMLRHELSKPRTVLIVENLADRRWVEGRRALSDDRVVLMPGAGVEPSLYLPTPEPVHPPIIVGVVARLIRSKGVDVAVDAVVRLRKKGLNVVLRVAGQSDPENPEFVTDGELNRWRASDGVELVGQIKDVSLFWSGVQIACVPSRGGEGLPRTLLEAAACGRPVVTTDAPGCGEIVSDGAGLVVAHDNVEALAAGLSKLATDHVLRQRLGKAARALIELKYTSQHAAEEAAKAWALLKRP